MTKQRSILSTLIAILGVLVQISEGTYTPLNATQIATASIQSMVTYGMNALVQVGYSKNKLPVTTYSITKVIGVSQETESTGINYACNVTFGGADGVVVKANYTVFVRSSNQAMSLGAYSYVPSNIPAGSLTNTTNTTNTTGTTNTTTPTNTTGNTGTTNTTGNTGTTNTTTANVGNSNTQIPQTLIANMSARYTRYHHYLWHNIRDNWNNFTASQQSTFAGLGWAPPRPALNYTNGSSSVLTENGSGEDFLFMHRHMIAWAKANVGNDTDVLIGWNTIPAPGDTSYPVPADYNITGNPSTTNSTNNQKTDAYYNQNILPWENTFTDLNELKTMTLGELGSRIEFSIHNVLHMRFSSPCSYGYRNGYSGIVPNVNTQWDNSSYNWLGDLYSAQVHPYFWRLHGWVDNRINDWMKAHNLTTIVWNNTWIGGPMSSLSSVGVTSPSRLLRGETRTLSKSNPMEDMMGEMMNGECDVLEKVMKALLETGCQSSFDNQPYMEDFVPDRHKYKGKC